MRAPILVFTGGLKVYPSRATAERVLAPGGPRPVDAFDATGCPLQLRAGRRGWLGLPQAQGVHLEAGPTSSEQRQRLRARLQEALVQHGAPLPWAEGAPLGALVAEAAKRLRG